MIVDFQHHYTPPELMDNSKDSILTRLNANQNPILRLTPLLADLPAHVRMMDQAGIDAAVLSCLQGFDEPDVATCRLINDCIKQAERDHPGRFIGLAHVPALNSREARAELKRCAIELGFPGIVIASELQGQLTRCANLTPVLEDGRRPRALCLRSSPAAGHRLEADGCGRPGTDARLGILPDGDDGAAHQ